MKAYLRAQRGFSLPQLMLVLAVITVLSVLVGTEIKRRIDDAAAFSTGRYIMAIREAVVAFQLKHEAWLHQIDTSGAPAGTYPAPPSLSFTPTPSGEDIAHAEVSLLLDEGLLPSEYPESMPLGERARLLFVRSGTCPGDSCQIQAFVYSCHPISDQRSSQGADSSCTSVPPSRNSADPSLLGAVLMAADGYGGHDLLDETRFRGPLVNVPRSLFPISEDRGRAVVVASMGATPFPQFVRQGDTRHVYLRNDLSVEGLITSNTGLLFGRTVVLGEACSRELMFAATWDGKMVVCRGGIWQLEAGYSVTDVHQNLTHDAFIAPPTCAPPMVPYQLVALQSVDMRVAQGSGMEVHGDHSGTVSGSGSVNAAGDVTVSGAFSGEFVASSTSYVHMGQNVSIIGNRISIDPNLPGARAAVIQGCRFN